MSLNIKIVGLCYPRDKSQDYDTIPCHDDDAWGYFG